VHEREVMALDLEGGAGRAEDLDLAGPVGLDPNGRVTGADVAQQRTDYQPSRQRA